MNRWRNYGLWVSIFSFIPILFNSLKIYNINLILPDNYSQIVVAFLGLLSFAGILSNPKEGQWFLDSKESSLNIDSTTKNDEKEGDLNE